MKVALVHDDLVQWGGAERVMVALSEIFPEAPIYTSVYDKENKLLSQYFAPKKIITSFLQQVPQWKTLYKALLPFYPVAFEQFDFSDFDVVISHSTRFAKSIITKPQTKHICYCPTPPRFLWNFSGEKSNTLLAPYFNFLRIYDQVIASRVDMWVANSVNVQKRIKKIYRQDAKVIYPFADIEKLSQIAPFDGGYLLVISRLNKYKRVDLAITAANKLKIPLKIIGNGPEKYSLIELAGSSVEFLGNISDDLLVQVLAGCKAVLVPGEEDFGMVSVEAQALGKPVIAYGRGGSLETIIDGETGYFFQFQTVESVIQALEDLDKRGYNQKRCLSQAQKFSKQRFREDFCDLIDSL